MLLGHGVARCRPQGVSGPRLSLEGPAAVPRPVEGGVVYCGEPRPSMPADPSARIDVPYVAKLARLALSPQEVEMYEAQLNAFLTHVDALRELDTGDVPATAQVIHARNVGRDDAESACLSQADALAGAPQAYGSYFRVPRIIGEE